MSKNNQGVAEVVASDAMAALTEYEWPGNVRELENVMHRSAVLSQGDSILLKDLPSEITTLGPSELSESNLFEKVYTNLDPSAGGLLKRVEVELIRVAIKHSNDDLSKAAKVLGITNAALKKKLSALESEK